MDTYNDYLKKCFKVWLLFFPFSTGTQMSGWFNRNKKLIMSNNTEFFWLVCLQCLNYELNKYQGLYFDGILKDIFRYGNEDEKLQALACN